MSKYFTSGLRAIALGGSVASAIAAYPAASSMFGAYSGGFLLIATATIIYSAWHYVATSDNTDSRLIAGGIAAIFAAAMTYGIYTSATIQQGDQHKQVAAEADALYQQQEQARMTTLASVTAELRATSKTKFPAEYTALQKQVGQLSIPTQRASSASQIVQGASSASQLYQWGAAASFEIVTLALLILAGFLSPRTATATEVFDLKAQLTATTQQLTATEAQLTATAEELTATRTAIHPLDALRNFEVGENADGNITTALIEQYASCTNWQAKDAIRKAVAQGILIKSGEGNATRYCYAKKLRVVK